MTTVTETIEWEGASGKSYKYWIYRLPPSFSSAPGNYIFAKEVSPGRWRPLYIGQTDDLSERFSDHHKAECVRRNGATHIHAHKNDAGQGARMAEETDLIRHWRPTCNG